MFQLLTVSKQQAPTASAPAASSAGMFDGLVLGPSGSSASASSSCFSAAASLAPAPAPSAPTLSFTASPAPVASTALPADIFSGMSLGPSPKPAASAPAAPAANSSAASLMLDTFGSAPAARPAGYPYTIAVPHKDRNSGGALLWEEPSAKATFDPLLSLDGLTAGPTHPPAPMAQQFHQPTQPLLPSAAPAPALSLLQPSAPASFNLSTFSPSPAAPPSYASFTAPAPSFVAPSQPSMYGQQQPSQPSQYGQQQPSQPSQYGQQQPSYSSSAFSSLSPSLAPAQTSSVFDTKPAGRSGSYGKRPDAGSSGTGSAATGTGFDFIKGKDAFNFIAEEVGKSRK